MTNAYNPGPRFKLSSSYGERIDPMTGSPDKFIQVRILLRRQARLSPLRASGTVVYSGTTESLGM